MQTQLEEASILLHTCVKFMEVGTLKESLWPEGIANHVLKLEVVDLLVRTVGLRNIVNMHHLIQLSNC